MTATECIDTLRQFNSWRRGDDKEMLDVKEIGLAIDMAIVLIKQRDELLAACEKASELIDKHLKWDRRIDDDMDFIDGVINRVKGGA